MISLMWLRRTLLYLGPFSDQKNLRFEDQICFSPPSLWDWVLARYGQLSDADVCVFDLAITG